MIDQKLLAEVLKLVKGRTVECRCECHEPHTLWRAHDEERCDKCGGSELIPDPAFAGLIAVLKWHGPAILDIDMPVRALSWPDLPPGALRGALIEGIRTERLRSPGAAWMFYTEGLLQRNFGKGDDDALETLKKALEELPQ